MKATDVRDFVGKMIQELADSTATSEEMALTIERAKATGGLVQQYVSLAKVDLDAARLYAEHGVIPTSIEAPKDGRPQLRAVSGR